MSKTLKLLGLTAAVAVIAGCARNEPEPVVFVEPAPIFTKDGQIVETRPVVTASEADMADDDASGLASGL